MSNDFILNSDIISFFEKNGVVLLKNMINKKWQRILLDAIEEDIKKHGPFFHAYKAEEGKGNFHGNLRIWEHYQGFKDYCLNSQVTVEVAFAFFSFVCMKKRTMFFDIFLNCIK
jgi:hypothetical protein